MIIIPNTNTLSAEPRYCPVAPQYIIYESAYSILSRFALYNVIHGDALVKIFAPPKNLTAGTRHRLPSLAHSSSLSAAAIRECFKVSGAQRNALFLVPSALSTSDHIATTLRFCPVCLVRGVHYSIFQYLLIQKCPIHQADLVQACRTCGGAMDYSLNSRLFHVPYGCCHCGRLLRRKEGQSGRSYLNKSGLNRLILAHKIFELGRARQIYFDVNQPTNVYFDNTTQFSSAIKDFTVHQHVLFDEVRAIALSGRGKKDASFYTITNTSGCSRVGKPLRELTAEELVPTLKCIFRHIRKRFFPEVKLSRHKLAGMWRCIEGSEIHRKGYPFVGYLDWLCFWYGVQAPTDLLSKANRCVIRKLSIWLESKRAHEVFVSLKGAREQGWLILKILAHEVIYFMIRQLRSLSAAALTGCSTDSRPVVYRRAVGPSAWALVVLPNPEDCEFQFLAHSTLVEISRPRMSKLEQAETIASLSH